MLYPSITDIPTIQKIDIKEPVYNRIIGSVKIQPVNLIKISELINDNESKLKKYVNSVLM